MVKDARKITAFRMSKEEKAMLEALAMHYQLTNSGVVRMLIKNSFKRNTGSVTDKEKPQKPGW